MPRPCSRARRRARSGVVTQVGTAESTAHDLAQVEYAHERAILDPAYQQAHVGRRGRVRATSGPHNAGCRSRSALRKPASAPSLRAAHDSL